MDILGIGPLEALFILILALIVVGPRDLGRVGRNLGRALNRIYRSEAWHAISQASRNLRTLPNRLAREAALDDLDQVRDQVLQAGGAVREASEGISRELKEAGAALRGAGTSAPANQEDEQAQVEGQSDPPSEPAAAPES